MVIHLEYTWYIPRIQNVLGVPAGATEMLASRDTSESWTEPRRRTRRVPRVGYQGRVHSESDSEALARLGRLRLGGWYRTVTHWHVPVCPWRLVDSERHGVCSSLARDVG